MRAAFCFWWVKQIPGGNDRKKGKGKGQSKGKSNYQYRALSTALRFGRDDGPWWRRGRFLVGDSGVWGVFAEGGGEGVEVVLLVAEDLAEVFA